MKIRMTPVGDLTPYAGNARTHSDAQIAQIAASIEEFGFTNPILAGSDGVIIAGHGRLLATERLGLDKVPVITLDHLDEAQRRALVIADNKIAENAGWDEELLRAELQALQEMDFDLDLVGFSDEELDELLGELEDDEPEGDLAPAPVPEPPEDPVTRPGDLWLLGNHRLLCGDSTNLKDVERLMNGQTAALFSTDPPYLVDYTGAGRPNDTGKDWSDLYREVDIKDPEGFLRAVFRNAIKVTRKDAAWYCWHAHKRAAMIEAIWTELGILNHQQIVWVKPAAIPTHSYYPWRHEPCLMGWQQGNKPPHLGGNDHNVTSVWELDWEGAARPAGAEHPTQKPLEVFAIPMRRHTRKGEICFEPFSGSGSQIVAGEALGREVFAMELQPAFVDVAIKRWQEAAGRQAVLEETGRKFDEISVKRKAT